MIKFLESMEPPMLIDRIMAITFYEGSRPNLPKKSDSTNIKENCYDSKKEMEKKVRHQKND